MTTGEPLSTVEAGEQEPLLPSSTNTAQVNPKPLPKLQLAAVYAIKLLVPVASTQVMPYFNLMIQELLERSGIEHGNENVGYYSGLVSTATHIAQLLSIYPWARLSDRIGRLPVILLGTTGIALSTVLLGLSQSFTTLLAARFFGGLFGGMIGAIHSVVGELSDKTNQSTVFPLYDIIAALGFVIGPFIGGTFANPITQHPTWPWAYLPSSIYQLLEALPYLLPCIITSLFALVATILGVYVLEETLPAKRKLDSVPSATLPDPVAISRTLAPSSSSTPTNLESVGDGKVDIRPLPLRVLLSIPVIRAVSLSSFALGFIAAAFNVVFVLVAYTDIRHGGLGFNPAQIGQALSIMGAISIPLKLSMTILLHPRWPNALTWLFNFTMGSWVITFLGFPLLSWVVAIVESGSTGELPALSTTAAGGKLVWFVASFVLFLSRIGCMAFTLVLILAREVSPNANSLGTTNGLTELAQLVGISASPVIISSLFAFSLTHQVLGGYLWVIVFVLASLFGGLTARSVGKYRSSGFREENYVIIT